LKEENWRKKADLIERHYVARKKLTK